MLMSQAIITISVYLSYIWFKFTSPLLSRLLLIVLFLWAIPNFGLAQSSVWVFYILSFLVGMYLLDKTELRTESTEADINGSEKGGVLKGPVLKLFAIGLGIILIFVIQTLTSVRGQFLGVPTLSAAPIEGIVQQVSFLFAPAMSGSLGIIENLLIFGIMKAIIIDGPLVYEGLKSFIVILSGIPFVGVLFIPIILALTMFSTVFMPILPFGIAALVFGLFHWAAYQISFGMIFLASFIMILWIVSFFLTGRDTTSADTAHFGHNALVTLQDSTKLAFTGPLPIIGGLH